MSPDPVSTAARGATHLRSLDGDAPDEAVDQLLVHADHLRDPWTGLFRHIWVETPDHYPQGTFWARGNGWPPRRPSTSSNACRTTTYVVDDEGAVRRVAGPPGDRRRP